MSHFRQFALASSILVLVGSIAFAQQPAPTAATNPSASAQAGSVKTADYSKEAAVLERMDRVYRYAADGTGSEDATVVIHVQDDSAVKTWSVLSFSFASSAQHVEVHYVRIHHPDGSTTETPASDAQEMPAAVTREAPFYSDLKEEQIPIRGLRSGDRLEYSVSIVRTRAEGAPNHFWDSETFYTQANGLVVLSESVELRYPKTKYVQVWSPGRKPAVSEEGNESVYRWTSSQLKPVASLTKQEIARLSAADADDDNGKLPDIEWTTFHSWEEVGAWYRGLEGHRIEPDDDIRAKVATLTAGKTTPEEKVKAIYGYVGPQIRYIGVAFGVGRYQPHEASEVMQNQYGDCKDKHTLLAAMLTAAGFQPDAVLIGYQKRFNEAVPSPRDFNHLITHLSVEGQSVWLDSTAEVAPYRLLLPALRDKQTLIVPASGLVRIERTPKDPPFPSTVHFDVEGSLDDKGVSHSHMVLVIRGDREVLFRQAVRSVSPSRWDELMQRFSEAFGYSGKISHAEFSRPEDTAEPVRITYDYEREKAGDWDNLRIIPQTIPMAFGRVDEKDPPVTSIALGGKRIEIDHAVMTLPPGWGADLPPDIHTKTSFLTFDETYKFFDGKIITDRKLEVLQDKLPAAEWRSYQKWVSEYGGENYIQLTRGGAGHAAGVFDPKAEELIQTAAQLESQRDWDAAKAKLDEAKKLNDTQAYLWSSYGYIAMMSGKMNEAITDVNREIAAHPDEDRAYQLLATLQLQRNQNKEAQQTLKKLLERSPENEDAGLMLGNMQMTGGDYTEAEKTLRPIAKDHQDNAKLQLLYAAALLRIDKKPEAETMLKKLLESDDPVTLNSAAYKLAEENLDLPLAEKAARQSIHVLETQIDAAGGGASSHEALRRATQLVSTWDTLGLILFLEGRADEGEGWVRAAWTNGANDDLGLHLGQILESLGKKEEALKFYELGQSAPQGADRANTEKLLRARETALIKAGTPIQVHDGFKTMQDDRTFKVERGTHKEQGWATVELEVSPSGVSNIRIVEGDTKLNPIAEKLKTVDFHSTFPTESKVHLQRRGVLSCHSGDTCTFMMMEARVALSDATP
ncbi:MAG TPA: DUF3857 domain-containing protein [Acidobacteriaceae bacterium]|jgi:predicted Zn-dependent protease